MTSTLITKQLYSSQQVRFSILHFLLGKSFSAGLGIFTTIIIARYLSIEAYGALTFLIGLTFLAGSISSVGLQHSYQRFIPEIRIHGSREDFITFSFVTVSINIIVSLFISSTVLVTAPWTSKFFISEEWSTQVQYWAAVVFFMNSLRFMFVLLETLMLQEVTKWLMIGLSILRLTIILFALRSSGLSLNEVIWAELISHALLSFFAMLIFFRKIKAISSDLNKKTHELNLLKRVLQFSFFNYLREMLFIFSGTATNRLVVAKFLSTASLAAFGFAQSLSDVVYRYMPSRLLKNLLRPALMGRFSQSEDYNELNLYANLIFKINNILLGLFVVVTFTMGNQLMGMVSGGRYSDSGWMLMLLIVWLFLNNHNQILEAHANAAEENKRLFLSTLVNSSFIFIAIPMTYWFNVWGLIIARCIGLFVRDAYLARHLKDKNIAYSLDWYSLAKMLFCYVISIFGLLPFVPDHLNWYEAIVLCFLSTIVYLVALYISKPFNTDDRKVFNKLVGRKVF
jgi:O-antigen/teichoic acid export membrane protein